MITKDEALVRVLRDVFHGGIGYQFSRKPDHRIPGSERYDMIVRDEFGWIVAVVKVRDEYKWYDKRKDSAKFIEDFESKERVPVFYMVDLTYETCSKFEIKFVVHALSKPKLY